jgi:hypothetical protein
VPNPTSPPRSVRSLADLRTLLPDRRGNRGRGHDERNRAAYVARQADPDRTDWSPWIPCFSCGANIKYGDAVKRQLGEGWVGFGHPEGQCDEAMVGEWRARTSAVNAQTRRVEFWQDKR